MIICQNCLNATVFAITVVAITSPLIWCLVNGQSIGLSPQRFAIEPTDKTAIVGDTVILPCRIVNKVGTLQWTRDGFGLGTDRILNGFPRYTMIGSDEEGDYSLQISSVSLEDDALFQCQVGAADGVRGIRSRSAQFTIFVPPEPPTIVEAAAQGDYLRTTSGASIELTCEAHAGKPPAEITWLDGDGNAVTKGIAYTTHKLSDGKRHSAASKWSFTASKAFDGKTLTCRSENSALKSPAKTAIRVEVKYAPEVTLRSSHSLIHTGDDVEFVCIANGNPKQLLYKWFKNDEEVVVGDHSTKMVLRKVGRAENGAVVTCEVSNVVGTNTAKHTLNVAYAPSFKAPSMMTTVYGAEFGQDVKLKCEVDGNPKPEITWLMLGSSDVLNTGPELLIKNLSRANVGKYLCRASIKGFDEISKQMLLFLKGPPRIKKPFTQYGFNGEAVKVQCLIESVPPPTKILWYHNSQAVDVDNNEGYEIIEEPIQGESSTLRSMIVIRKSKLSDFGQYNCSVWNLIGHDSRIITLLEDTMMITDCMYDTNNFDPQSIRPSLCIIRASLSSVVLIVGIIICGIVIIVAFTIIFILCLHRNKSTFDSDSDYQNSIKKGVFGGTTSPSTASKQQQHHHQHQHHHHQRHQHSCIDSNSSSATDSDIKVEIRTASSLSQQWDDIDTNNDGSSSDTHRIDSEIARVVENIYSYTSREPTLNNIYATNTKNIIQLNNNNNNSVNIPPFSDYNNSGDYLLLPNSDMTTVSPNHYRTAINLAASSYRTPPPPHIDQKMYRTIVDNSGHQHNANNNGLVRTSMSLLSSSLHQQQQQQQQQHQHQHRTPPLQLSSQMFSAMMCSGDNQKYITNNGHTKSLATHV